MAEQEFVEYENVEYDGGQAIDNGNGQGVNSVSQAIPMFTHEQYMQLMNLLQDHKEKMRSNQGERDIGGGTRSNVCSVLTKGKVMYCISP